MSNDNKTLADVQPGGRVRLGDQLVLAKLVGAAGLMLAEIDTCGHEVDPAYRRTLYEAWEEGKAALSAQPSPGGQDALAALQQDYDKLLDSFDRQVEVAEKIAGRVLQQDDRIEELEEALAARQPVGEPFGYCADFDPGAHEFSHTFYYLAPGEKVPEGCTPFFTKQPAQAVDLRKVKQLIGDLRTLGVKESTKNDNAGFVDLRCYWALLGLAVEVERSMTDSQAVQP